MSETTAVEGDELETPAAEGSSEEQKALRERSLRTASGELKSAVGRRDKNILRAKAAVIAVDMEEHRFIDPRSGKPWVGSYSKSEIAFAMGYSRATRSKVNHLNRKYPAFLQEPEFGRYVDWERFKRVAHGNMSPDQMRPTVNIVASALSMELVKRALLAPEQIASRDLLQEARKYVELALDLSPKGGQGGDVHTTINVFMSSIEGLPPAARAKAREIFQGDIARLTALAGGPKVVETVARR